MTHGLKPGKRRAVWKRETVCHYCQTAPAEDQRTADHVWPKAFGGPDALTNLVASCRDCNRARGVQSHKCFCDFCVAARVAHARLIDGATWAPPGFRNKEEGR